MGTSFLSFTLRVTRKLHKEYVSLKVFLVSNKNMGLCLYIDSERVRYAIVPLKDVKIYSNYQLLYLIAIK